MDFNQTCTQRSSGSGVYRVCSRWRYLSDFPIISSDTVPNAISPNLQNLTEIQTCMVVKGLILITKSHLLR